VVKALYPTIGHLAMPNSYDPMAVNVVILQNAEVDTELRQTLVILAPHLKSRSSEQASHYQRLYRNHGAEHKLPGSAPAHRLAPTGIVAAN
jgi:hypothetical protein